MTQETDVNTKDVHKGYKKQKKLSIIQFFIELPDFFLLLAAAFFSKSLLVAIDLLDSFGELLKSFVTALISKKLSRDLRFEYNYGIGKVEALSALICESIIFLGVLISFALSIYELFFPSRPSDLLIFVVGLKILHVGGDLWFFIKQRNIKKNYSSAITKTSYASSLAALLFDSVTLVSLLTVWLFRENPVGQYLTPVISMMIAVYLMFGCVRRMRTAIGDLTDKTLNEDAQLKILSVINRFHQRYSSFHALNSRNVGGGIVLDLHISFDKHVTFEEILKFKEDMQAELNEILDEYVLNIIV